MPSVVLLKGVNVGGHRRFRPTRLAEELRHLDVVSIGATGSFVVRKTMSRTVLRQAISKRLPFEAEIMICRGAEITGLLSQEFFSDYPARPDIVRFVSVLSRARRSGPVPPVDLPSRGPWLVRVLARRGRFLVGLHRRRMKVIGELARLEEIFGSPVTTRSWSTISAIGKVLRESAPRDGGE